jgi:TonB family protein
VDTGVATRPGTVLTVPDSHGLVITFELSAPLSDMPSANKILAAAFDSDGVWKKEFAPYGQPSPSSTVKGQQAEGAPSAPRDGDKRDGDQRNGDKRNDDKKDAEVFGVLGPDRPVYKPTPHVVQAPVPTFTPDPEYSTAAKNAKLQGVIAMMMVVNERGEPEVIKVTRRLGSGLDEQALIAVSGWKFKPANRDGHPVAVLINVEMEFHLY